MHKIWSYGKKKLVCDSCDFIFDQKWHNLSLSDHVLADIYLYTHVQWQTETISDCIENSILLHLILYIFSRSQ